LVRTGRSRRDSAGRAGAGQRTPAERLRAAAIAASAGNLHRKYGKHTNS
jgi:hypothetical protein